jgi:tetratricopeptide (TPR) repeat protein
MDTRKNGNYNLIRYFILFIIVIVFAGNTCIADNEAAAKALIETYKLSGPVTPAQTESAVANLKKVLPDCTDGVLIYRISYRAGMLFFFSGMFEEAKAEFSRIANDSKCPESIRAYSLNMTGQISRLKGDNTSALDAFGKAAVLLQEILHNEKEPTEKTAHIKLLGSVMFARAQIYEQQKNSDAAITEYNCLLDEMKNTSDRYMPLAGDRLAQLYLRKSDFDKYEQTVDTIIRDYPNYYRTGIIEMEKECVKFLRSISSDIEFPDGGFDAPALTIAYLKDAKTETSSQQIREKFESLCEKYQNTYAGIVLSYQYASLLYAHDEKEKAMDTLRQVFSDNNSFSSNRKTIDCIREYARIQYAIIAGEQADYNEAMRVLSGLQPYPDESHISELAKAVNEGLQTLKRQVTK